MKQSEIIVLRGQFSSKFILIFNFIVISGIKTSQWAYIICPSSFQLSLKSYLLLPAFQTFKLECFRCLCLFEQLPSGYGTGFPIQGSRV